MVTNVEILEASWSRKDGTVTWQEASRQLHEARANDPVTAIIRNPRLEDEDHYGLSLMFDVFTSEGSAALTVVPWDRMKPLMERCRGDYGKLEGQPCWVDASERGIIRFVKLWSA